MKAFKWKNGGCKETKTKSGNLRHRDDVCFNRDRKWNPFRAKEPSESSSAVCVCWTHTSASALFVWPVTA